MNSLKEMFEKNRRKERMVAAGNHTRIFSRPAVKVSVVQGMRVDA